MLFSSCVVKNKMHAMNTIHKLLMSSIAWLSKQWGAAIVSLQTQYQVCVWECKRANVLEVQLPPTLKSKLDKTSSVHFNMSEIQSSKLIPLTA